MSLRPVLLAPSPWSETSIATAAALADAGYPPVGAVSLRSWSGGTILRKSMQWGPRAVLRYAARKLASPASDRAIRNPELKRFLAAGNRPLRTLHEAGARFGFEVAAVKSINSPAAIERVRRWRPDIVVYTGGGIVRRPLLDAAGLGVLNSHAGLLPEIRGMSAPEWSLLNGVPPGVTVHLMDDGVDTGPVLLRRPLEPEHTPRTLEALRNRLAALGVELKVEAVRGLDRGALEPRPQPDTGHDRQHFVMHEALVRVASRRLARAGDRSAVAADA